MITVKLFCPVLFLGTPLFANALLVQSVAVPGSNLEVKLSTHVGHPYDTRDIDHDLHYLWELGRFDDVRVETIQNDQGVDVIFRTTPKRYFSVREVRLEPNSYGLQNAWTEGTRIDRRGAQQIAQDAESKLRDRGFLNARVTYEFRPAIHHEVDLRLKVDPGPNVKLLDVQFTGETGIPSAKLRKQLHALRPTRILPGIPHLWNGWRLMPAYTPDAVDSDVARLQSYYFFHGYPNAVLRPMDVKREGNSAQLQIEVHAGPQRDSVPQDLCSTLFRERRQAERRGVLDFPVHADVDTDGQLTWKAEPGQAFWVGRIQFWGNHHYSDSFLRGNFVLDEGQILDERRLRQSISRLNQTGAFDNINEHSVAILRNSATGVADIQVRVNERKKGSWNFSGPVGPLSLAGPLQASVGTRLPSWGRGIFELSTYTVSISVFAFGRAALPIPGLSLTKSWYPVLALQRPYTSGQGWLSGFAIAPELGWPLMAAGYLTTQLEQRLLPLLNGDRGLVPDIPIEVHRPEGDTQVACQAPAPRLSPLRTVTGMALRTVGSFSGTN